ncbi:MAG: hypothetical protein ABJL18_04330 [Hyphomicrobiales bacterium]
MSDKLDILLERIEVLQYDVTKMETRMDAFENELRLMAHEQAPQLAEMRQELRHMKQAVDTFAEFTDGGKPIEALQPAPRR